MLPARGRPNDPPALDRRRRISDALERQRSARHARFDLGRPGALETFDSLGLSSDDEDSSRFDDAIDVDAPAPAAASRKSRKRDRKWLAYADKLCVCIETCADSVECTRSCLSCNRSTTLST